jgi:hypothetical protein
VLAFSGSVQAEMMRLADGDAISVQGVMKADCGEKRVSLTVVADHVLALRTGQTPMGTYPVRQPGRQRALAKDQSATASREPVFDDEITF